MTTNIRIDGNRLWDSLMELAKIGATEKGGVCRLALTDLDRQARDLFQKWCTAAGCTMTVDKMGNIFARRPGMHAKVEVKIRSKPFLVTLLPALEKYLPD